MSVGLNKSFSMQSGLLSKTEKPGQHKTVPGFQLRGLAHHVPFVRLPSESISLISPNPNSRTPASIFLRSPTTMSTVGNEHDSILPQDPLPAQILFD